MPTRTQRGGTEHDPDFDFDSFSASHVHQRALFIGRIISSQRAICFATIDVVLILGSILKSRRHALGQ